MATDHNLAAPELGGVEVHGMTRGAFVLRGALATGAVYGASVVSKAPAQSGAGDIEILNFALFNGAQPASNAFDPTLSVRRSPPRWRR